MPTLWATIQRHWRYSAIIAAVAGALSGRARWLEIGEVWFLGIGALVKFLQTGGPSLAASMAILFPRISWTPYRLNWLTRWSLSGMKGDVLFRGVGVSRRRKIRPKHNGTRQPGASPNHPSAFRPDVKFLA